MTPFTPSARPKLFKHLLSGWRIGATLVCVLALTACELRTEQPLFTAADAAPVTLQNGYYKTNDGAAYLRIYNGTLVVAAHSHEALPRDALAIDLGSGLYLLQYGPIDQAARKYVIFRQAREGRAIQTAVYDCSKFTPFFDGFGIEVKTGAGGGCLLEGVTKASMLRAQRALAKILPDDAWTISYERMAEDEGARQFAR